MRDWLSRTFRRIDAQLLAVVVAMAGITLLAPESLKVEALGVLVTLAGWLVRRWEKRFESKVFTGIGSRKEDQEPERKERL